MLFAAVIVMFQIQFTDNWIVDIAMGFLEMLANICSYSAAAILPDLPVA
jgi:hypothetical protein